MTYIARFCIAIIFSLALQITTAWSSEVNPYNYDYVVNNIFWNTLHESGGWTLYCGYRFDQEGRSHEGRAIGIEHIYMR